MAAATASLTKAKRKTNIFPHLSAPHSKRQKQLKQRRKNGDTQATLADFKQQRDTVASQLVDADLKIVELTQRVAAE